MFYLVYMTLRPIVLVPGVGGSKLLATDKRTKEQQYAWLNTSYLPFSTISKAAEFLWGDTNADGVFKSYLDEYIDITPVPGIKGCDKLLDWDILDSKLFESIDFHKYFSLVI